ncbi:hypothetical protein VTI74DRAFT_10149 [Chaetomium olivicolor]
MNIPLFISAAVGIGSLAWYRNRRMKADKGVFSGIGWQTLRLDSTEDISPTTKKLRFALPDPGKPSGLPLTSALLTVSKPADCRLPVARPYTPVNDLDEPGFIELMVKLYAKGKQSPHLHSLKPGDTLTFVPIPELSWKPNKYPQVALLAGGMGITPMYQLVRGILKNPEDKTRIHLVWGVNEEPEMFLKDELDALQKNHPDQLKVTYVVRIPRDRQTPYRTGMLKKEVLEEIGLGAKEGQNKDTKVLVCGPPGMIKMLQGYKAYRHTEPGVLAEMGYKQDQVYYY